MILFVLAYLGGVLTIISPCILPVLPFVFARADQPFLRSGLPMLIGMAATFALVATLAAVGGGWAVAANTYARYGALGLLALFGIALLFPQVSDRLMQPLVRLGDRLSQSASSSEGRTSILASALLGVATGLLWAPCAGPILGLILTGAALQGASAKTSLLLLAYAAGGATSLALALLVGGKVFGTMKRMLGAGEWVRRGLGIAVIAAVVAIALGADTGVLSRVSQASTTAFEQGLVDKMRQANTSGAEKPKASPPAGTADARSLPVEGPMPSIAGATEWLNSPPLTNEALKGKVVLVDFWTYSCINCLRTIPYVRAWAEKYKDKGLVVIGIHTPEFAFEKDVRNIKKAVADLKITYPVAVDNDYAIWRAFSNEYWPAHYFIDRQGRVRHHHFGEGEYAESEQIIQKLLEEGGHADVGSGIVSVQASGAEAASRNSDVESYETYVGYARAENFASPEALAHDKAMHFTIGSPGLNKWGLVGDWTVRPQDAHLDTSGGAIVYRFHARDLHLVLGPGPNGKPVRFRVTIDGKAPADDHGGDVAADGAGTVTEERLYQLVRQHGDVADHTFRIEFFDPGVQAYAFTFG